MNKQKHLKIRSHLIAYSTSENDTIYNVFLRKLQIKVKYYNIFDKPVQDVTPKLSNISCKVKILI